MTPGDALAIELAAERRRAEEAERAKLDARRAELPRVVADGDRWRFWRKLLRRVLGA